MSIKISKTAAKRKAVDKIKAKDPGKALSRKAKAKPDPAKAKVAAALDKSKARLASKPKPTPAAKPSKPKAKREKKANTYEQMAKAHTGASTIENPVQAMWNLCDDMQDKRRKEVIEAAVAKGISYYTARTQYQLWLTAFRNS